MTLGVNMASADVHASGRRFSQGPATHQMSLVYYLRQPRQIFSRKAPSSQNPLGPHVGWKEKRASGGRVGQTPRPRGLLWKLVLEHGFYTNLDAGSTGIEQAPDGRSAAAWSSPPAVIPLPWPLDTCSAQQALQWGPACPGASQELPGVPST